MSRIRKIATAAGTFSVALGIGFVMQNGDVLAARFGEGAGAGRPSASLPGAERLGPSVSVVIEGEDMEPTEAAVVTMSVPPPVDPAPVVAAAVVTMAPPPAAVPVPATEAALIIMAPVPAMAAPAVEAAPLAALPPVDPVPAPPLAAVLPVALQDAPPAVELSATAPSCDNALTGVAGPLGMATLTLSTPCAPGQVVTFHHEGLRFAALTDAEGRLELTIPALAVDAVFVADLGDGQGAVAVLRLPEVAALDRAVLQWQGTDGLNLHAFEFGAEFGGAGHVWQAAARSATSAQAGVGGYMVMLGDPGLDAAMMAQVYTYPSGTGQIGGRVDLQVEAQVTPANCGRDIEAQAIQLSPGAGAFSFDLSLSMPGCDAEGEFLALPDLLLDLTLAAAN